MAPGKCSITNAFWLALLLFLLVLAAPVSGLSATTSIQSVQSQQKYYMDTLRKYAFVYSDRDFAFTRIPSCLLNARYIVTANSDKFTVSNDFMRLNTSKPVNVYIGYDSRFRTQPGWLSSSFRPVSGLNLLMGQPNGRTAVNYQMYKRSYNKGTIVLGGNFPQGEKANYSMYTVVIVDADKDQCR